MLVIIIAGLKAASDLLTPIILALFLATISTSIINFFITKGVPSLISWISVLLFIIGFILIFGFLLSASVYEFTNRVPLYINKLDLLVDQFVLTIGAGSQTDLSSFKNIYHPDHLLDYTLSAAGSVGELLSDSLLILFVVIFMLIQRKTFVQKIQLITHDENAYLHLEKVIKHIDQYILILTLFSALTGITVYIVLNLLGIDFALLWAFGAFFLNFIPNIGSIIAAIPPVLIALIDHNPLYAGIVTLAYLVINLFFGSFLQPRFVGKGLDLSILVVFLSLVFWGWVFGPVGMFLSVPITIMFKILFESMEETRWIAILLGNDVHRVM